MAASFSKFSVRYALGTVILTTALAVSAAAQQTAALAEYKYSEAAYSAAVSKLTAAGSNVERAKAVHSELLKLNIRVAAEGFNTGGKPGAEITGTNVIADVPARDPKRVVMIGAHLDRVKQGKGAIDNASGVAAVVELLRAFAARPMQNVTLKGAFWDAEERGLVGSRTWIKGRKPEELPAIYINFDVFGYGDTLWLWANDTTSEYAVSFKAASGTADREFVVSADYPPSDHLAFKMAGVESYSFSLLPGGEIASLRKYLNGGGEQLPNVMRTIHSDSDTDDKVKAKDVAAVLPVVERSIRALDK